MAAEEIHRADSGFFGSLDGQTLASGSLTSRFSFEAPISATLQSLFSIRKRNACVRKVEAEGERRQYTHTYTPAREGKEERRNSEDKMAFIPTAVEGQKVPYLFLI